MQKPDPEAVTQLLERLRSGEAGVAEDLLPMVYEQLQHIAAAVFAGERQGHTLQATALIHEAWLKLGVEAKDVRDRRHFFALAARAMRQVLADYARGAKRDKRGGGNRRLTLVDPHLGSTNEEGVQLVELEDSLTRLATLNPRHARVVELRVFGGLTIPEAAEVLDVSQATIERDWFVARGWLRRELRAAQ